MNAILVILTADLSCYLYRFLIFLDTGLLTLTDHLMFLETGLLTFPFRPQRAILLLCRLVLLTIVLPHPALRQPLHLRPHPHRQSLLPIRSPTSL